MLELMIGVDDTGGEGQQFIARSVDPHRRTLVAALSNLPHKPSIIDAWKNILLKIQETFPDAKEFHAAHLYNRTGDYKNIKGTKSAAKDKAVQMFAEIARLVKENHVCFIVQTVHSDTYSQVVGTLGTVLDEARANGAQPGVDQQVINDYQRLHSDLLASQNRKLVALYLLASQVEKRFGRSDTGLATQWEIDHSNDFPSLPDYMENIIARKFSRCDVEFMESAKSTMIQIADFGAYVLNRHQYIAGNRSGDQGALSEKDMDFLHATKLCAPLFINISAKATDGTDMTPEAYDREIDDDRSKKGLAPLDFTTQKGK